MNLRRAPIMVMALTVTVLLGCTPPGDSGHAPDAAMTIPPIGPVGLAGRNLRVVATTNVLGDVVAEVGSGAIDLTTLIGPGQDPHSYQPVAQDMVAIEEADVVFVVGLNLEETLMRSIENTATGPVVPVSAGITPIPFAGADHEGEGEHGIYDPHFWMDPNNVMVWTATIRDTLSTADPAHAAGYAANAEAYRVELAALDGYIREQAARIPASNRRLVTDHYAFGYFAEEYGFEIAGAILPGPTTTTEPSAGEIADLAALIRENGIPAIFVGASASESLRRLAETIAQEAGGGVQVLSLYSGSLDSPGQPADTYIGMMRTNVDTLVQGLGDGG